MQGTDTTNPEISGMLVKTLYQQIKEKNRKFLERKPKGSWRSRPHTIARVLSEVGTRIFKLQTQNFTY